MEVALRIHEADADERHAEIAGFLAVIAGQHAEAAGVDRQRLVQRELRGEVRDVPPLSIAAAFAHHGCATVARASSRPQMASSYGLEKLRIGGGVAPARSAMICCSIRTGLCAVARQSV